MNVLSACLPDVRFVIKSSEARKAILSLGPRCLLLVQSQPLGNFSMKIPRGNIRACVSPQEMILVSSHKFFGKSSFPWFCHDWASGFPASCTALQACCSTVNGRLAASDPVFPGSVGLASSSSKAASPSTNALSHACSRRFTASSVSVVIHSG